MRDNEVKEIHYLIKSFVSGLTAMGEEKKIKFSIVTLFTFTYESYTSTKCRRSQDLSVKQTRVKLIPEVW